LKPPEPLKPRSAPVLWRKSVQLVRQFTDRLLPRITRQLAQVHGLRVCPDFIGGHPGVPRDCVTRNRQHPGGPKDGNGCEYGAMTLANHDESLMHIFSAARIKSGESNPACFAADATYFLSMFSTETTEKSSTSHT